MEYNNSSFVGLVDGRPAKTVHAFIIQSVAGKYKGVVCLISVNKLNTPLLRHWFDCVLDGINDLFLVMAISVDNHVQQVRIFIIFYEDILVLKLRNVCTHMCLICFHQPLISIMVRIKVLIMVLCLYLNSAIKFPFAYVLPI